MLGDETDSYSNHTSLPRPSKVVLVAIDLTNRHGRNLVCRISVTVADSPLRQSTE